MEPFHRITTPASAGSAPSDRHGERQPRVGARRIISVVDDGGPDIAYQPIRRCSDGAVVGYEALSRFADDEPPDVWFRAAGVLGLSGELERSAIDRALTGTADLPPDVFLAVNVSPASLVSPPIRDMLLRAAGRPIVVEITEGAAIAVGDAVHRSLIDLRAAGLRLALDDVGTGQAGLRQILTVQPDVIKLDATFARGIDADPTRRAIARAMILFSRDTGALCVFEGVETAAELAGIVECGGELAQGFLLGRPGHLPGRPTNPRP